MMKNSLSRGRSSGRNRGLAIGRAQGRTIIEKLVTEIGTLPTDYFFSFFNPRETPTMTCVPRIFVLDIEAGSPDSRG